MVIACVIGPGRASAQVSVEITPPELDDGLAQVETLLAAEVNAAAAEVTDLVNALLEKPRALRAVADATVAASSLRPHPGPGHATRTAPDPGPGGRRDYYLGIGSAAGVAAETLRPNAVQETVDDFEESDDPYLGAAANPLLVSFSFPAARLLPGLRFHTAVGYLTTTVSEAEVTGLSLATSAEYPVVEEAALGTYVDFAGVSATAGLGFLRNEIATEISPGTVRQTFTLDPDGQDAPIFAQEVTVEVRPEVEAALETRVYTLSVGAVTGIRFLDFLGISVGGTAELAAGGTSLQLSADEPITLIGPLTELVRDDSESRLVVSGSTDGVEPSLLQLSTFTALTWRVSSYRVSLPVSWRSNSGLAVGLFWGVTF